MGKYDDLPDEIRKHMEAYAEESKGTPTVEVAEKAVKGFYYIIADGRMEADLECEVTLTAGTIASIGMMIVHAGPQAFVHQEDYLDWLLYMGSLSRNFREEFLVSFQNALDELKELKEKEQKPSKEEVDNVLRGMFGNEQKD